MSKVSFYDVHYRNNTNPLYKDIRNDVWNNQDIGLTSFLSTPQIDQFIAWFNLQTDMKILDACCGTGQILAYVAKTIKTKSYGIDINDNSITIANSYIKKEQLPIEILKINLNDMLPFPDASFDVIICLESIIHFSMDERLRIFSEWYRILKPGAKLMLTDPCLISGGISDEELANRSMFGGYFFLPPGLQEKLLVKSGFSVTHSQDLTIDNAAIITHKWWRSRERRQNELKHMESEEEFDKIQLFLKTCDHLYNHQKMSQIAYYAERI